MKLLHLITEIQNENQIIELYDKLNDLNEMWDKMQVARKHGEPIYFDKHFNELEPDEQQQVEYTEDNIKDIGEIIRKTKEEFVDVLEKTFDDKYEVQQIRNGSIYVSNPENERAISFRTHKVATSTLNHHSGGIYPFIFGKTERLTKRHLQKGIEFLEGK